MGESDRRCRPVQEAWPRPGDDGASDHGLVNGRLTLTMRSPDHVPCVLFEDEHLLVVRKPARWNTHAPDPYAGEGIYD